MLVTVQLSRSASECRGFDGQRELLYQAARRAIQADGPQVPGSWRTIEISTCSSLMDVPVFPGSIVPSRLVGVIETEHEDGETERNDRLLAVAANSAAHRSIRELGDLSQDPVAQIEHFFVTYNEINGKRFEVKARRAASERLVTAAMKKPTGR